MENGQQEFGFEIDFLPVGDKTRSGDAICLRWGYNLCDESGGHRQQFVMVVDGGYAPVGESIVNHVKNFYKTSRIDVVVNTHPHRDHINGLSTVMEKCVVSYLSIHRPWEHTGLKEIFKDGRVTAKSIKDHLKDGLEKAYDISKTVKDEGKVKLTSCFAPTSWSGLCGVDVHILGPTKDYYESLLPAFTSTPTDGEDVDLGQRVEFSKQTVPSECCPLTDAGETSAENNSGIILAFKLPESVGGGIVMLTGDAGIPALLNAATEAERLSLDLSHNIRFFQVPHHGSIQNLGPSVLKKVFGKRAASAIAYISVSANHDNEHPAKHVTNALLDCGVQSFLTAGQPIRKAFGKVPVREGWVSLTAIPHYPEVEKVEFSRKMQ